MKRWGKKAMIVVGLAWLMRGLIGVEPAVGKAEAGGTQGPVYKPPRRGAPAGRVGGGTRGATERESFTLLALAPDHVGFTTRDQPCLYWFLSQPTGHPVEVVVTAGQAVTPLLEKMVKGPEKAGIQALCLAEHDARLTPGVEYKWFVAVVTDTEQRSKDILAGGLIELLAAPAALRERLRAAGQDQAPLIYAEAGYWYDALAAITSRIESGQDNAESVRQRAALLEQVGLAAAAGGGDR